MDNLSSPVSLAFKSLNTSIRQSRRELVEAAMPHAVPKRAEPVNACQLINEVPLKFCSRCSISQAPGQLFFPWHKFAVGGVTSPYPRPLCGPLLGRVHVWSLYSFKGRCVRRCKSVAWCTTPTALFTASFPLWSIFVRGFTRSRTVYPSDVFYTSTGTSLRHSPAL